MKVEVPAMLIQPLLENAIRHGLIPRETPGLLTLSFIVQAQRVICVVEDNGVGRETARRKSRDYLPPSRGLQMLRERINTLNRVGEESLSWKIIDLVDQDGTPRGTRVLLYFSLSEN